MVNIYILISIVLLLWLHILWRRRKFYKLIFELPGEIGFPLFGQIHKTLNRERVLDVIEEQLQKFGSYFYFWVGPIPVFVSADPEIIQDIYTSTHCIDKAAVFQIAADALGNGLLTSNNPRWSKHRKLWNPAFGVKFLTNFLTVFNKDSNNLLDRFDSYTQMKETDIFPIIQEFTLNISLQTTMGKNLSDSKTVQNSNVLSAYQLILENITEMTVQPWLHFKIARQLFGKEKEYSRRKGSINQFIQNLLDEKLNNNNGITDAKTFINVAIDHWNNGHFTLNDIGEELNALVFAGFESTAATITHTLIMLAMFPEYQQRVYEEICTILPERGACELSYDDIQQMIYLDMVVNETMRVITTVPLMIRKTTGEVTLSNGVILPAGVQIVIDMFHLHRSKDIWGPEAHNYNPDNFLRSNLEQKPPYAFIPFSKGLRTCIGTKYAFMSMKVTLAKLIRNYYFKTDFPFHKLQFIEDVSIKLRETPLLQICKRDS